MSRLCHVSTRPASSKRLPLGTDSRAEKLCAASCVQWKLGYACILPHVNYFSKKNWCACSCSLSVCCILCAKWSLDFSLEFWNSEKVLSFKWQNHHKVQHLWQGEARGPIQQYETHRSLCMSNTFCVPRCHVAAASVLHDTRTIQTSRGHHRGSNGN